MKINYKSNLCFLTAALIWGLAFVFQDIASETLGHFTINGLRCLIAFVSLIPFILIRCKKNKTKILEETKEKNKFLIIGGIVCGISLSFAMNFQQLGISLYNDDVATSGRAGFIVGLYVVMVPILSMIFLRKKININIIISVLLAILGLYLLCFGKGISNIYIGDIANIIAAICFASQILFVDKYVTKVDGVKLSAIQLLTCGTICSVLMLIFEQPKITDIINMIYPILFLGVLSSGVAYTVQILGQKYSNNPTVDAIIMSLESVFAVLGGAIILEEVLEIKEIFGCIIMFIAIIISQVPLNIKTKNKNNDVNNKKITT